MADTMGKGIGPGMTFYFVKNAIKYPTKYQRRGQSGFNALDALRPDIANKIRGTLDDPFYNDNNIERFLLKVIDLL